jgi:hypothetical protein
MIYLIGQLSVWLVLTAAFAGLAGWALAAERAAPEERASQRERENLLRDITRLAAGESGPDAAADERESDAMRRLIEVRDGRIAELEAAVSAARARADEAATRIAELERASPAPAEDEELSRLRMLVAQHEEERSREVEVSAEAVEEDDTVALQAWRLRYFEQRVRYLEGLAAAQGSAEAREQAPAQPLMEWRARDAEARAAHLEQELRTYVSAGATAPELMAEAQPFAADADIDALLRWRLLYLERRVAHLQGQLAQAAAPTPSAPWIPTDGSGAHDIWRRAFVIWSSSLDVRRRCNRPLPQSRKQPQRRPRARQSGARSRRFFQPHAAVRQTTSRSSKM